MRIGIILVLAVFTLVSVASAVLPTAPGAVSANINYRGNTLAGPYWDVDVLVGDTGVPIQLPAINDYTGWCSDISHTIGGSNPHSFTAYSDLQAPSSLPVALQGVNWKAINWIINHPNPDWRITQAAIWHFDGWKPTDGVYPGDYLPGQRQDVDLTL